MIWEDVILDREVVDGELAETLSQLLQVDPQRVLVVDEVAEANPGKDTVLICEKGPVSGDFRLLLSLYVLDESFVPRDRASFFVSLSSNLECRCLVADNSDVDPYVMLLVEPGGSLRRVSLDPERLDQHDEYALK